MSVKRFDKRADKGITKNAKPLSLPQLAQFDVVVNALREREDPAIEVAIDNSSHNRDRMQREKYNQRHNLCV